MSELDKTIEDLEAEVTAELEEAADAPKKGATPAEKGSKVAGDVEDLGAPVVKGDEKSGPDAAKKTKKDATIPAAVKGDQAPQKLKEEDESDEDEKESDDEEEMDEMDDEPKMAMPKTGKAAEEIVANYMKTASKDDKIQMASKCMGNRESVKKESLDIDSIDVTDDVNALVEGEDLSEEFTAKATVVFEAAVKSKLRGEVERLDLEKTQEVAEEVVSIEDAQLLLARCLREYGYDITDPKNDESLQSVLRPVFLAADQKGREELFETIQTCADENDIPLGGTADFENPEEVADTLDTELEFAQCLREKGIEVEDPNAERPLRSILISLVQSGQYLEDQIREAAGECFDDLGLEPPQQGGS